MRERTPQPILDVRYRLLEAIPRALVVVERHDHEDPVVLLAETLLRAADHRHDLVPLALDHGVGARDPIPQPGAIDLVDDLGNRVHERIAGADREHRKPEEHGRSSANTGVTLESRE